MASTSPVRESFGNRIRPVYTYVDLPVLRVWITGKGFIFKLFFFFGSILDWLYSFIGERVEEKRIVFVFQVSVIGEWGAPCNSTSSRA